MSGQSERGAAHQRFPVIWGIMLVIVATLIATWQAVRIVTIVWDCPSGDTCGWTSSLGPPLVLLMAAAPFLVAVLVAFHERQSANSARRYVAPAVWAIAVTALLAPLTLYA